MPVTDARSKPRCISRSAHVDEMILYSGDGDESGELKQ
jgi:hypothetical protein